MNHRTAWIVYSLLRLVFFAVPFAALYLMGWPWWLALIVAALVGLSLSVIFLSKQRSAASVSIHEWRTKDRTIDDIAEDEAVEASAGAAGSGDAGSGDAGSTGDAGSSDAASTGETGSGETAAPAITDVSTDAEADTGEATDPTLGERSA